MANKFVYNTVYSQEVYTPAVKAITDKTKVDWEVIAAKVKIRDEKCG
jgi:hypothetical protein